MYLTSTKITFPKYVLLLLLSLFFLLSLQSCVKQKQIVFSTNKNSYEYVPGIEWAVITEPVVMFRESCSFESNVKEYVRRGDIFPVRGKNYVVTKNEKGEKQVIVWYGFDGGWLEKSVLSVYSNKMQAERAALNLSATLD